ncbi:hypothetical protein CN918_32135 [Priestia megaterium]|nr:hypothetical protein CN918_32135 [Priestia megaterium]
MLISSQSFPTLLGQGVRIKQCKRIKMKTNVYMLTLKWLHVNQSITLDVLLVFQDLNVTISIDSLKGNSFYTEQFRRELSGIVQAIIRDVQRIPSYRFHFLYNKINLSISPPYLIRDNLLYQKRLTDPEYSKKEAEQIIQSCQSCIQNITLPPHQPSEIYFKKILMYGYDGIEMASLLEKEDIVKRSFSRTLTFPHALCEFKWGGIHQPFHNREAELIKVWHHYLSSYKYSCEIKFNDF